jgi:multimeric flavodoxin WrbA
VTEGIASQGGSLTEVYLPTKTIERCRQCNNDGWGICRSEGRCIIDDDFAPLTDTVRNADLVVFATPVYFSDLAESLRAYLDRLRRITRHEAGRRGIEDTPAVGVCVAGGGGGGGPACCVSLEKVLRTCGFDVFDLVPVRRQNLEQKLSSMKDLGAACAAEITGTR